MDLISGLPIHPLINHAVAVLVPLAAVGVLLVIFIPKLRSTYSPLVVTALFISTISAFIATQSGEALAERVGLPNSHAIQGERLSFTVSAFFVLFSIWFVLERSDRVKPSISSLLKRILKVVIPITAVASFALTIIVGHSGAEATWKDRIAQSEAGVLEDLTPNASSKPNTDGSISLSVAEIKTHDNKSDCWSIVNANVYNLTSYVQNHPGGAAVIANICGKDGTKSFTNQHNTQGKPNNVLRSFLLGPIGASITADAGKKVIEPPITSNSDESGEQGDEESDDD